MRIIEYINKEEYFKMKKFNYALTLLVIVACFFTLNLFLSYAQDEVGYAGRIASLEAKMVNHESRIVKLEKSPVTNTTNTSANNANGQWARPDGNGWWFPEDDTKVTRSASGKVHWWCQWANPRSVLTWKECKDKFGSTDSDLCTLCTQHLVPPGGVNPNKAPAKNEKLENKTVGAVKK